MSRLAYALTVGVAAVAFSSTAMAQGVNNTAFIDQFGGGNTSSITQTGNNNAFARPGSTALTADPAHWRQGSGDYVSLSPANSLTSTQTGNNNQIARDGGTQSSHDKATFVQDNSAAGAGGLGNAVDGYYSGSRFGSTVGNTVDVMQKGDNNLVHYIFQDHNRNSAQIEMIGNGNGRFSGSFNAGQSGNYRAARLLGTAGQPGITNDGHGGISVATLGQDGSSSDDAGASAILKAKGDNNSFNVNQTGTKLTLSNIQTGNGNYISASQNGTSTSLTNTQTGNYNVLLASQGTGYGQGNGNTINLQQGSSLSSEKNMAEIVQNGNSNLLVGYQLGSNNYLLASQQGDSNNVYAYTTGDNNTITSYQTASFGGGNTLYATQTGNNNTISNTQNGSLNVAAAIQAGNNNSATFNQSGMGGIGGLKR